MALTALEKKAVREALRLLRELMSDLHQISKGSAEAVEVQTKQEWPDSAAPQAIQKTVQAAFNGAQNPIREVTTKIGKIEDWLNATIAD